MPPISAPTKEFPITHELAKQMLSERALVYYALGAMDTSDIPTTFAEFLALFSGSTPKFKPFGAQIEEGSKYKHKQVSSKYFSGSTHRGWQITPEFNFINITVDLMDFLDSPEYKEPISLLFVPEATPLVAGDVSADNPATFFALSGITLINDLEGGTGGKDGSCKFTADHTPKHLKQIVKYKQFTTAT